MPKPTEAKPRWVPCKGRLTPGEPHPQLSLNPCPALAHVSPVPGGALTAPLLPYSRWTCRTWSASHSSSTDSRPTVSGRRSRSRSECRLFSVTSQSCWELLCSRRRSCWHSLPWGSEGSGAGPRPHCEGRGAAPAPRQRTRAPRGHLRASSAPQPGAAARVLRPRGPWDETGSPRAP